MSTLRHVTWIVISVLSMTISGCQSNPFKETINEVAVSLGLSEKETPIRVVEQRKPALPDQLNQFIDQAKTGDSTTLNETPWGGAAHIVAGNNYTAASGRKCRILRVRKDQQAAKNKLVCRKSSGNWVPVRPITYNN